MSRRAKKRPPRRQAPVYPFRAVVTLDPDGEPVRMDAMQALSVRHETGGCRVEFGFLSIFDARPHADVVDELDAARYDAWLEHGAGTPEPRTVDFTRQEST